MQKFLDTLRSPKGTLHSLTGMLRDEYDVARELSLALRFGDATRSPLKELLNNMALEQCQNESTKALSAQECNP